MGVVFLLVVAMLDPARVGRPARGTLAQGEPNPGAVRLRAALTS
ncbi:hypothetical protein F4553_004537 [Allocatelliglobosispora scoriae]|uniref:Uncharacterized protein n=1 Tax=Allocatelliglobosispora scoriae TaxID=643052 RepID=A0A841BUN0_9ACTN|nr:hypothetical protein [Allocatelliglobosispora scoriae]MBB5871158.1 hypothetical protein [Allocatelliglobosispora scoriae]